MKQILLTNDDGYDARGILELREMLKKRLNARVILVAPHRQKSACSHSLSLHHPLRLKEIEKDYYHLDDGTPSDCVYVGLSKLFDKGVDLVISGVNHGANLGEDISYSGTCAGAMEAVLQGVNALASSLYYADNSIEKYGYELACELTCEVAAKMLENPPLIPPRQFLNLNIPACAKADFKGLKVTYTGKRNYDTRLDIRFDPRGGEYIWIAEPNITSQSVDDENSDIGAVLRGFASLSPIKLDMCAKSSLNELSLWANDINL